MKKIPIKIDGGRMPVRGSEYAAAFDVFCPEDFELVKARQVVPLGFHIQLPVGWKANIRPRSGFSAKGMLAEVRTTYRRYGGEIYTSVESVRIDADVLLGLVDSDYRDVVGAIIKVYDMDVVASQRYEFDTIVENHVYLTKDTRIAQMEICGGPCELEETDELDMDIDRGGGYGHTGA